MFSPYKGPPPSGTQPMKLSSIASDYVIFARSIICDKCFQIVTIHDQVLIIGQTPFESFKPYIAAGQ